MEIKNMEYSLIYFILLFILWIYLVEKTFEDRVIFSTKKGLTSAYPNKFFSIFQFFIGLPISIYLFYNSYILSLPLGYAMGIIFFFIIIYILFSIIFSGVDNDE